MSFGFVVLLLESVNTGSNPYTCGPSGKLSVAINEMFLDSSDGSGGN